MDTYSSEWFDLPRTARTRIEQIDSIAAFRRAEGRWPLTRGDSPSERTLARNVRSLRDEPQHETVIAEIAQTLGDLPEAAFTRQNMSLADALAAFETQHGRLPRASGETTTERNLARRVARHRGPDKGTTRFPVADQTKTGRHRTFDTLRFERRVRALLAARDRLGHWPRRSSDDREERALGYFHVRLRQPLPEKHIELLKDLDHDLGRWATDGRGRKDRNFEADVKAIAAYLAEHGRKPRRTDPDEHVRRLARRLASMRSEGVTGAQAITLRLHLPKMVMPTIAEAAVKRAAKRAPR